LLVYAKKVVGDRGGRGLGEYGVGVVREVGEERAVSGSSKWVGSGREMRNTNFF